MSVDPRHALELGEKTVNQLRQEHGLPPLDGRSTRLHIRSGGSSVDTFVTTDDGRFVEDVLALEWKITANGLGVATITLDLADIDATGETAA